MIPGDSMLVTASLFQAVAMMARPAEGGIEQRLAHSGASVDAARVASRAQPPAMAVAASPVAAPVSTGAVAALAILDR